MAEKLTVEEQAKKVVSALTEVRRQEGEAKALEVIDVWVEELAKQTGELDTELKDAAYAYVKRLTTPSRIDIIMEGWERLVKTDGVDAALAAVDDWFASIVAKKGEVDPKLKEETYDYIKSLGE